MSDKRSGKHAMKYKAKCIKFIIDNNIIVPPSNMDISTFNALRDISTRMSKNKV